MGGVSEIEKTNIFFFTKFRYLFVTYNKIFTVNIKRNENTSKN